MHTHFLEMMVSFRGFKWGSFLVSLSFILENIDLTKILI